MKYKITSLLSAFSIFISDVHVVSFEKSGRTWLRVMLVKLISDKLGVKQKLDPQFMTLGKKFPNIVFSHAGGNQKSNKLNFAKLLRRKKIIFLVRDPRDVVVSLYHEYTKRRKIYSGGISEFIRDRNYGLEKVIHFMNYWSAEIYGRENYFLLVRFEDMKKDTIKEMKRIVDFLGVDVRDEVISAAVEYGSLENMKKLEQENAFKDKRMKAGGKDPNSFKVRKGKVGGFKEELSKKDIKYVNNLMEKLSLDY